MPKRRIPELLAPAGSIDAVRAAVANGADAIYLGASRFNARDAGAQLTLDELRDACRLAHSAHVRIYLTLNVLIKPAELVDALMFLGEAIDCGIDAAIVQDVGLITLIRKVYPELEIHGSTQMTVHDAAGAAVIRDLGVDRVVLARENTLEDLRAIHSAVPDLGLETFVHGALCIAYSGQCFMSGMISERSANRGSCAQSCRKDYVLRDERSGAELDRGYLISAKDLAANEHLDSIADAGIGCLKIEGRKKRPEYVATVTKAYRGWLDELEAGRALPLPDTSDDQPLVQIFSRGFTGGMYGGRAGRDYITRDQPDHRGVEVGRVVGSANGDLLVDLTSVVAVGDGLGFAAPESKGGPSTGFTVDAIHPVPGTAKRFAVATRKHIPAGWVVYRTAQASLLDTARKSYAAITVPDGARTRVDVRAFGSAGQPLKMLWSTDHAVADVRSEITLSPASKRPLDAAALRTQLDRLGDTPLVLGDVDVSGLAAGLFIPVSEVNHLRQRAVDELLAGRADVVSANDMARRATVNAAVNTVTVRERDQAAHASSPSLVAQVFTLAQAEQAAEAGAQEVCVDPFLRHPMPPVSRVRALAETMTAAGVPVSIRLPTIVRPEDRKLIDKWIDLGLPMLVGHFGLIDELARAGRAVTADYAVNAFNQHTAAQMFALGAQRIVASVELTTREIAAVVAPWRGSGFDVVLHGRPEGMTLEHCVLSAAFDREVTTCRDLCVQKHPNVTLTDPAGYTFPVATDYACRNRLLHSRTIDGSEFLPELRASGITRFHLLFNTESDRVADVVRSYRQAILLAEGGAPGAEVAAPVRAVTGPEFTRGHFARAV